MAKKRKADDYDSPWKDALQSYFQAFLAFFFPDIGDDIDWSRGYESLDKEFQQIARRAKVGRRIADKLFKLWRKDGQEHWLLVHVEVQGAVEADFPHRMFDYNVAARRLYNHTVVSLAVLCDDDLNWRPTTFGYGQWGCSLVLTFRVAKLLDHVQETADLPAATNPFAAIVQAHWAALQTRSDPGTRRQEKLRLVKALYQGKWTKQDVRQLFSLIDWIMTLPEDLEVAFRTDLSQLEEEKKMRYVTSIERYGYKKGLEKGLEQGLEKGLEQGLEKGLEQGLELGEERGRKKLLLEMIAGELEKKFAKDSKKHMRKVQTLGADKLRDFLEFVKSATTLDEVRDYLK